MGLVKERAVARAQRLTTGIETWVDREVAGCEFKDERLGRRFCKLLAQIGSDMGQSIPLVCQDWANTKAAYRFFSNERVDEADILGGHFEATRERVAAREGPILVLHDTTEFSLKREKPDLIGFTGKTAGRTQCGILMHSSLAVTTEGLPLGLSAIKFWTRKKFKGTTALKRRINPTHGCRSSRRRASAGSRIYGNRPTFLLPLDDAFILVIARATSMSCFAWPRRLERISWCEPVLIGLPGTAIIQLPTKWTRLRSRVCIGSRSRTTKAIPTTPFLRSGIARYASCRRSANRRNIPHSL
ncbi:hypothetical protein ABIF69_006886 [Bradyrhizobium japonicum]